MDEENKTIEPEQPGEQQPEQPEEQPTPVDITNEVDTELGVIADRINILSAHLMLESSAPGLLSGTREMRNQFHQQAIIGIYSAVIALRQKLGGEHSHA